MTNDLNKLSFWCFLAVLGAIVLLYSIGAILAYNGKPMEALGLGGAGTGLIGVLGTFKPRAEMQTQNIQHAGQVKQDSGTQGDSS